MLLLRFGQFYLLLIWSVLISYKMLLKEFAQYIYIFFKKKTSQET